MRALIQRVSSGSVRVDSKLISEIGYGMVILLGVSQNDSEKDVDYVVEKCSNLRIFPDKSGKFNLSCLDCSGEALVVSQFTLYADTRKGRRPNFIEAGSPGMSEPLYERFIEKLNKAGVSAVGGVFGAHMDVEIHNDGPVTIMVESKKS